MCTLCVAWRALPTLFARCVLHGSTGTFLAVCVQLQDTRARSKLLLECCMLAHTTYLTSRNLTCDEPMPRRGRTHATVSPILYYGEPNPLLRGAQPSHVMSPGYGEPSRTSQRAQPMLRGAQPHVLRQGQPHATAIQPSHVMSPCHIEANPMLQGAQPHATASPIPCYREPNPHT